MLKQQFMAKITFQIDTHYPLAWELPSFLQSLDIC